MNLLSEIVKGATDSQIPVSDLLRKCKILAKRLRHQPLADWAEMELNGYWSEESIPRYRKHRAEVLGTFAGSFGRQINNVPIPSLSVEEEHRDFLFTMKYPDGVAHFEALLRVRGEEDKNFHVPWPADFVSYYAQRLMNGFVLGQAYKVISPASVEGMLDQVRNRILSFALEVEEENPMAGESVGRGEPPIPPQRVDQIFNTVILGGTNVVASGSNNRIEHFAQEVGDWEGLTAALKSIGLAESEIVALQEAIEEDVGVQAPGPKAQEWLGKISSRIASGSMSVGSDAAGSMIAALVMKYLGVL